jgi:hypothetical protein
MKKGGQQWPPFFVPVVPFSQTPKIPCGSELAPDEAITFNINID